MESVEALTIATRLWSAFIEDLGRPENGLSQQLARGADLGRHLAAPGGGAHPRPEASTSFAQLIEISSDRARGAEMSKPMRISLRAGERIYINGAVLRVDRRRRPSSF